ncbi:translocation/assembly module TamB domain-containing protein [Leptothoe sp. PORK10 BA2]|uniref:translocation/assembly module TamB domain-containing protein n=1 Tax=Leptothoe sp. PORK10 BA2 TaxID=3110254 RepID=UPI002B1FC54B|nr:translocation/assembly module TamB domain-containing protein [Leptothoe sp. PORK10 BA2]MEA5463434.1 translocation/assembly module TamB domain-containing protein [Leptothoe sp. PORK10 BA2]
MTSPNADRPPEGRRFWKIAAITCGTGALLVGTAVAVGSWLFINRGLTPLLERRLSILLERELELGDLEGLSWNGLRVGPSTLNATAMDPTYVTTESVEVGFNPLQVLFERKLDIDLRLTGAAGYLEQHPDEGWIGTDIPTFEPPPKEPLIKVRMDEIEVMDSAITLVPLPADGAEPTPLLLSNLNGLLEIVPVQVNGQDSQRMEFEAQAKAPQGGDLGLTIAAVPVATGNDDQPIRQNITMAVTAKGVAAEDATAFLLPTMGQQNFPMVVTAGRVSGNWAMTFLPDQPITVDGAASVNNGQLQLTSLPSTGPWGNTIDGINATTRFKGTTITVDRAKGSYADLTATATGTINWKGDYDLVAQVADVDLEQLLERAEVEPPIALSGVFDSTVAITGPVLQPKLKANLAATGPVTIDRVVLKELNGDVELASDRIENLLDVVTVTQVNALPELGGRVTGQGVLNLGQLAAGGPPELDFAFRATDVSGDAIATLYDVEQLPVTLGILDATATIIGPPAALAAQINVQAPNLAYGGQIYPATATAVFANGGLTIPQAQVLVGNGTLTGQGQVGQDSWQADLKANNIDLRALGIAQIPPGQLNADVALAGPLQGASLETILAMGDYDLQLADGSVQGEAELINGGWNTTATLNALGLGQFASQLRGNTSGTVTLAGRLNAFTLADIQGQGDLNFSAGLAGFSPQLAGFDAPLSSQFAWTGQELLIERASSAQLRARGVVSPQFVGNQFQGIRGFSLDLDAQRYPLALLPSPVPVAGFASFNGKLMGTPSTPRLDGTLRLDDFAVNQVAFDPVLTGPISYQSQAGLAVNLVGQSGPSAAHGRADGIEINFQTARNFDFDISWQGALASGRTDGDVLRATLQDLQLQALGVPAVERLGGGLKGSLSSQGEWVVDLNRQTLVGDVLIARPGLGYLSGQQLTGQVAYRSGRIYVEQGELILDPCFLGLGMEDRPISCVTAGTTAGNSPGDQQLAPSQSVYRFNGDVQLNTLAYNANVEVENGDVRDVLTALAITDLESLIQTFQPPTWLENPPSPADIPDILAVQPAGADQATLLEQLQRLSEIQAIQEQVALAEAAEPIPPLAKLQGRFDASVRLSGTPQQLPEVMFDVNGQAWSWGPEFIADRVIAQGQLANGNLILQPLRLETQLPPDADGNPQLAFVNLAGNLSLVEQDTSSLQLVAQQLPMAAVRDIFNLPLGLEGRLNAIANFSGGLGNPTVRGDVILANGSINNQPIQKAEGLFLYEDARLLLQGNLLQVDNPQPLTLVGDIPYAFDFMTVQPADDRIALTLDVADEGLSLLNALNNQVSWVSGKGRVSLDVGGRLSQPIITGEMELQEAVLRSPLLPDPLTDFEGRIVFENNQIIVQNLQGKYGNGQLQAAGIFPLLTLPIIRSADLAALGAEPSGQDTQPENGTNGETPDGIPEGDTVAPPPANPTAPNNPISPNPSTPGNPTPLIHPSGALTVTLDNVDLELRGIYRGGVKGQVVVGGSLFLGGPQLGGVVELADGRLFLPEGENTSAAAESEDISPFVPRFENLKITLADNIQIQQGNLLNVLARGDLLITGPLIPFRAIEPEGTIRLRSGRINLLTTTFRLAGRDNTARFIPERGIADPILDIQLRTTVSETQQNLAVEATAFASSEISDTSIDPFQGTTGLETIRIRADYQGSASNLLESLFISDSSDTVIELSSSPPRSRQEIINLLSGSYVAALQSGQGVINFFGGALLNSLQDFISSTLNLSEFRLFPVTSASRFSSEDSSGSSLDIATEVGFDVTNNVTLSLVKILTDSTPTEFNLRYRLTDELTIRGTTNFDDRNQVLLEFETRF